MSVDASTPQPLADPTTWIRQLRPSTYPVRDTECCYEDEAELERRCGRLARLWALEVGERVALRLASMHPDFADAGAPLPSLRHGVRAGAVRVLLSIATNQQLGLMTRENRAANREFVRIGIPLPVVLQAIHDGSTWILDAVLEQIEQHGAALAPRQMRCVVPIVLGAHDDFAIDMQERYLTEHARWASGVSAARKALTLKLLAGATVDTAAASTALDYPLDGPHVGYVLTADETAATRALQRVATDLMDQFADAAVLLVPDGERQVWIWHAGTDVAEAPVNAPGVRVGYGRTYCGADGFRLTHQQAVAALRVGGHRQQDANVRYRDVELVALLTAQAELADAFVTDTLGKLAAPTPEMREMRETIAAYLEEHGSLIHAAKRLYVNRNTVSYRLAKAERLLGRPVKTQHQELLAAIAIGRLLIDDATPSHQPDS